MLPNQPTSMFADNRHTYIHTYIHTYRQTDRQTASRLVALSKPSGDVRPIAVGECIRRLTDKTLCLQKKESFSSFLSPLQHGVAVEGGPELIVHHISLLLESNPDWVILKTDLKNAFNSVSRSHLLPEVAKAFPDIYQHVHQMYAVSVLWFSMTGKLLTFCSPRKESTKGTPLHHAIFCRLASISFVPPEEPPSHPCPSLFGRYVFIGPMEDVLLCLNDGV